MLSGEMGIKTVYIVLLVSWLLAQPGNSYGQTAMINFTGRDKIMLNGNWQVMVDPFGSGDAKQVWKERKPVVATDFVEYSFDDGPVLKVPGDFNTQLAELNLYEGIVWYKKQVQVLKKKEKRYFLYFGAVNYLADVFFNGVKLGSHEGGFTPFQFEITGLLADSNNTIIVKTDNRRIKNGLPGLGFDWFNYGGITRDVAIIVTEQTFIKNYFIQLKKGSSDTISGWVQLDGKVLPLHFTLSIPEIKFKKQVKIDDKGHAMINFKAGLQCWSPQDPKRYIVRLENANEKLVDTIGFRTIEVKGRDVLLNGKKIFLKSVNIHEENPLKKSRCANEEDADLLLTAAKDLGCNMVRLAHYPHNEAMVRTAERMGIMVWSELPVYQHINFSDSTVPGKIITMQQEMVTRDKNRCAVIIWSLSNETYPGTPNRNATLINLTKACRNLDDTRLVVHVTNTQGYTNNVFTVWDPIYEHSDLVAVNEYIGWYLPWQGNPEKTKWDTKFPDKPLFISEFGGESLFGYRAKGLNTIPVWTEEYQKKIYEDQIRMFEQAPGLCGVAQWILFDYKSPVRMNQVFQKGYNRKGLLSENGNKKLAWYIINNYYKRK
jgi:beta-glucuronidase